MGGTSRKATAQQAVSVSVGPLTLAGDLEIPENACGIVLFAHGSGSSRHSSRNRYVAGALREHGLGTLLFDLLTLEEEAADRFTAHLRFNIHLLAERLIGATEWLENTPAARDLGLAYFGASTGAAAALAAAAQHPDGIRAIVSRGGRPDLAGSALARVKAPTLLIVGGDDAQVLGLNEVALDQLRVDKRLDVVPGASHLFEEPGALERVAELARDWFLRYL